MAYDKVIDSSVLEAGLTAIADAIREKAGTTDALAFPTAMAEAIAAIEAGGDGVLMTGGTITPAAETNEVIISHSLGVIPNFVLLFTSSITMLSKGGIQAIIVSPKTSRFGSNVTSFTGTTQTQAYYQTRAYYRVNFTNLGTSESSAAIKNPYYTIDENNIYLYGNNYQDHTDFSQFRSVEYYWIAVYNPLIEMWGDFS